MAGQIRAQNLGHESLTTTFGSYGKVSASEQARLSGTQARRGTPSIKRWIKSSRWFAAPFRRQP